MGKEILCTIGPASLTKSVLERLNELPVSLLRINLSHTSIEDLPKHIQYIKKITSIPICIDSEGAQIRTGKMHNGTACLVEGGLLKINRQPVAGNSKHISFYPEESIDLVQIYDLISIDFNTALIQVVEKKSDYLIAKVITEGSIGSNKAVSVNRQIRMNPLTRKDEESIKIAVGFGVKHFALSFANHLEDVQAIRHQTPKNSFIISKIESREGIRNLEAIADASDAILIDRGDLSREEPIESIPLLQKHIINKAKSTETKVYVATNLLESMVTQTNPTRAEVNDIFNTLLDGADGLVLAAETAIGNNPVGCVNMISKLMDQFNNFNKFDTDISKYEKRSLLIEAHGGSLVSRVETEPDIQELSKLPVLEVDGKIVSDCEQIATGVYSPLQGFMTKEQVEGVLNNNLLPEGTIWTLPIIFPVWGDAVRKLQKGDSVALKNAHSGEIFALLYLEEIFPLQFESMAKRMFGTNSPEHPGVKQLKHSGDMLLGGKIDLIRFSNKSKEVSPFIFTPQNTRMIFEQKNWYRVAGFHTRNIVHAAHEYIQQKALDEYFCDGLFISPVVGPKKKNDFKSELILMAYQRMIELNLYPKNRVLVGAFFSFSRYAGPREAVFTAICRKNYGCSHFIVGRDHTGINNFYPKEANIRFFEGVGDIGIKPIFFDEAAYCDQCEAMRLSCEHPSSCIHPISGTLIRDFLDRNENPPGWMMREEIANMLIEMIKNKEEIFIS